jgi:hypothetical protein
MRKSAISCYCQLLPLASQIVARVFPPALLAGAVLIAAAQTTSAQIARVWALDDGTKVIEDELEHPLAGKNLTFDPGAAQISLTAARGETVAFQVIVQGGPQPSRAAVQFDALAPSAGAPLRNAADSQPGALLGRRIDLFLEQYVTIRERSHDLSWAAGAAEPAGFAGKSVPDALIPLASGSAFELPAHLNRAVWIDIYVPPGTAAGVYRGTLAVLAADGKPCPLPGCRLSVELELLDLELPARTTAHTMLWFSGGDPDLDLAPARYLDNPRGDTEAVRRIRLRHFQLARRHRITLFIGKDDAPGDPELAERLTGKAFSRAAGYDGPGEGLGQDIYVIHAYGGTIDGEKEARGWIEWLNQVAPGIEYIYYVKDEPKPDAFPEVNRLAARGAPLPSFTTAPYQPGLDVQVYCADSEHFRVADARAAAAHGRRQWIYNGKRPFAGSFVIDDVAVSPRVNPWIQYRFAIERWFYWESTYYKDTQGGRGNIDVFVQPDNFATRHGDLGNGEGLLFYPGRDRIFPRSDHGLDFPFPSIRLKNWRRGLQDVDYLAMARSRGMGAFVDELLTAMIPLALADELSERDAVPWSESGEDWLRARRLVMQALITGQAPSIPDELRRSYMPRRKKLMLKAGGAAAGAMLLLLVVLFLARRRRGRVPS